MNAIPYRQIRAVYDTDTIRVYQAYSDAIADAALAQGAFVSPLFKMERMTWIKPSFLWMMYRAGWGLKDAGQRRILAIDIARVGFDWALAHAPLSHRAQEMSEIEWQELKSRTSVRIQWDPERDLLLRPQPYRSIQIGLGKDALELYVRQWIRQITDVTCLAHEIHELVRHTRLDEARENLPVERHYPIPAAVASLVGAA